MSSTLVEQAKEHLQGGRGRMTQQRRLILQVIESLSGHPTAEEIYAHAHRQDPNLNLSTVYRTLRRLEEMALVSPRRFNDDPRTERFDPTTPTEHYHFRCQACGKIIEFDDAAVEQAARRFEALNGAEVANISLVLYGTCRECSKTRS